MKRKRCTKCGRVRSLNLFYQRKTGRTAGKYESRCRDCKREEERIRSRTKSGIPLDAPVRTWKRRPPNYCRDCGKKIPWDQKRCLPCYGETRKRQTRDGKLRCSRCRKLKAEDAFTRNTSDPVGRRYECRDCKHAIDLEYTSRPEIASRRVETTRRWKAANRERARQHDRDAYYRQRATATS